ncbi:MAG TPA: hypothetical protein DCP92_06510 [Nitrospiraceae bacterium]|nr:hypothetical protein [Nitrospiraceae bacterium]
MGNGHCGKGGEKVVRNPFVYPLDLLILMYALAWREGIIAHAAGVVMRGRGYVFPGRSGTGKSTLVRQFNNATQYECSAMTGLFYERSGTTFLCLGLRGLARQERP